MYDKIIIRFGLFNHKGIGTNANRPTGYLLSTPLYQQASAIEINWNQFSPYQWLFRLKQYKGKGAMADGCGTGD